VARDIAAILLAAGESTRMARPKQLLPWNGMTLIEWQIAQLHGAGASRIVTVLGSRAEELKPVVEASGSRAVTNDRYLEGRASSLRTGAVAFDTAERVIIINVDQPRPAWVTRRLLTEPVPEGTLIVSPRLRGHGGHPVLLDGSLAAELRDVTDETLGLRAITERHKAQTVYVDFENPCVIVDLNTPAEYENALAAFERGDWDEDFGGSVTKR
jgi:molybdenum cofactor cytidylyltransferase